jgi:hypothetical protein
MTSARSRAAARFALLLAVLTASSLACQSLVAPTAEADYEQAFAATQAVMGLAMTQQALSVIQTARAAPTPTSPPPGAHSPEIVSVNFPASIPANGAFVHGSIKFVDAGLDMNSVSIETLEGNFASGSWDPTGTISWTGVMGVAPFDTRCTAPQTVRARVILRDSTGSASIHSDFAFRCE